MNTLKVAGHAPTQAGGHRLSSDRHTTRKKKAIEKYIKKKMSLKRERERDLSPSNCSGAAAGVSRGYGQDLRRFFFDFSFSIFFVCGCVLLSHRDSQWYATCWLQAPPSVPLKGRQLLGAPTRFLLCSIGGEVERARARSSHHEKKTSHQHLKKGEVKERKKEKSHPPTS